jgi:hypothetical protein
MISNERKQKHATMNSEDGVSLASDYEEDSNHEKEDTENESIFSGDKKPKANTIDKNEREESPAQRMMKRSMECNEKMMTTMKNDGLQSENMNDMRLYRTLLKSIVPDSLLGTNIYQGIEKITESLLKNMKCRDWLCDIHEQILLVIDLHCFLRVDMFSGSKNGITRAIQTLICKLFPMVTVVLILRALNVSQPTILLQ